MKQCQAAIKLKRLSSRMAGEYFQKLNEVIREKIRDKEMEYNHVASKLVKKIIYGPEPFGGISKRAVLTEIERKNYPKTVIFKN